MIRPWSRQCTAVLARGGLVAALTAGVALGGCVEQVPASHVPAGASAGASAAETEPTAEITFAYWALAPHEIQTVHELVKEFESRERRVRVRLLEPTDRYYDKLITLFAADEAPDAFAINYGRLGDFARRGLVADLTPLLAQSEEVDRAAFVPVAYDSFQGLGDLIGRPGLYGLPRDWGPTTLLVDHRDAFDAAGLPYPSGDWSWEEFTAACHQLTLKDPDGTTRCYGAAVCLYPYAAIAWFYQNDGEVFSAHSHASTLADEGNVEALRFLKSLVDAGVVVGPNPAHDESLEQFRTGRVAMTFATPYALPGLREESALRWGVAPPLVGKKQATGCIPTGVAVSARTPHLEAACRFAVFWATRGAQRVAEAGFCVPAWQPALEAIDLTGVAGFGPQMGRVIREAAPYARPHPICPHVPYERAMSHLKQALEAVFVQGADPADALQAAQDKINAEAASGSY